VTVEAGRLSDHVAVITGGASGIGPHTAKRLLAEGGAVALWDIDAQALPHLMRWSGGMTDTMRA
jgi:NAD(P)-dependent dehydrogenase (short-subunit alcohol dehydrogenase family)